MSIFDKMPIPKGSRGTFDLSKMHTSTMDFFRWDVAHCLPCVPNDVISLNLHTFVQAAPNPFPINGRMQIGTYAFFVPTRIVWPEWTQYITDLQSNLTIPYFTVEDLYTAITGGGVFSPPQQLQIRLSLSNVLGLSSIIQFLDPNSYSLSTIPSNIKSLKLSAVPLRCMQRIWFDWMRDKAHISDSALSSYCSTSGGHITVAELQQLINPKYRLFSKNYITTAFDQPSEVNVSAVPSFSGNTVQSVSDSGLNSSGNFDTFRRIVLDSNPLSPNSINGTTNYGTVAGVQIQDLRSSNSLQTYAERMLVAGKTVLSRFQALFGTQPTIEELQMSDYLGGHEEDLLFQTTNAGGSTRLTDISGTPSSVGAFGYDPKLATLQGQKGQDITSGNNGSGLENITYKTDEHGYLFVFCAITPVPQYYQGLERDWFRGLDTFASDKFDFFHQDFENEGLQPVLNYEVMLSGKGDSVFSPKGVFGFQQKYMDYKYAKDSLGGSFVNPSSSSLFKSMHLGRDIQSKVETLAGSGSLNQYLTPAILTQTGIGDKTEYDSKFTIGSTTTDHFIVNHKIMLIANRPMQQNAIPALSASESRQTSKDMIDTSGFRL